MKPKYKASPSEPANDNPLESPGQNLESSAIKKLLDELDGDTQAVARLTSMPLAEIESILKRAIDRN